ncbi:MAG TPA: DUF3224 domain-containing protein [Candidatus Acidoferrum sp.]|nr:DUF3224 domain-containing protein [Candidatus Acidoferrum sp.]
MGLPELSISVAPDSGTGELTSLTGDMQIKMPGGKQFYEFSYALPESPDR